MDRHDDQTSSSIIEQYFARFGDAGDFDRWVLPGDVNERLMAEALKQDKPVTRAILAQVYEALEGEPLPDDPTEDMVT